MRFIFFVAPFARSRLLKPYFLHILVEFAVSCDRPGHESEVRSVLVQEKLYVFLVWLGQFS